MFLSFRSLCARVSGALSFRAAISVGRLAVAGLSALEDEVGFSAIEGVGSSGKLRSCS